MLKDILYYLNENKLKNLKEKICANNRIILETAGLVTLNWTVFKRTVTIENQELSWFVNMN